MVIEVKEYKRVEGDGNVIAKVSFYIPEWHLHINDCRYIRTKNGGFFVGFPSRREDDKYLPYISFDKEAMTKFQESARKAVEDWARLNI